MGTHILASKVYKRMYICVRVSRPHRQSALSDPISCVRFLSFILQIFAPLHLPTAGPLFTHTLTLLFFIMHCTCGIVAVVCVCACGSVAPVEAEIPLPLPTSSRSCRASRSVYYHQRRWRWQQQHLRCFVLANKRPQYITMGINLLYEYSMHILFAFAFHYEVCVLCNLCCVACILLNYIANFFWIHHIHHTM